ncbi:YciI family protein [Myxococcus qinghaiensis]|uniref:YciI family protein n=1 Tax=Myxococcus qinghaiensis TaxID=2906758 RepID=UPI0020A7325A|nr:YciI family protein [Myxococcus qinghaiensis]MCP3162519.1 YciI family protein [Myxococcus qinghaiensis]
MRFMLLLKASQDSEVGAPAGEALITEMDRYNDALVRAGVLLDGAGLHPSSRGARIAFSQGKRTVTTGPFTATNELIAGFWMIQVKTPEEALEWARRWPHSQGSADSQIELRQVFEPTDFPEPTQDVVEREPHGVLSRS